MERRNKSLCCDFVLQNIVFDSKQAVFVRCVNFARDQFGQDYQTLVRHSTREDRLRDFAPRLKSGVRQKKSVTLVVVDDTIDAQQAEVAGALRSSGGLSTHRSSDCKATLERGKRFDRSHLVQRWA